MAYVLLTRRLVSGGLRRPAPSTNCCAVMSSFENLSLNNNNNRTTIETPTAAPITLPFSHSYFSTAAPSLKTKKTDPNSMIVELPPNLKFDPRAKSSPFYGVERVKSEKQRQREEKKAAAIEASTTAAATTTTAADEEDQKDVAAEASNPEVTEDDTEEKYELDAFHPDYDSDVDDDYDEEEDRILYDLATKPDIARAIPLPQRLHVPVMDIKTGEEVGTFHLSDKTFGIDPIRVDILHRVVIWQRNKKRGKRNAGARTKTISENSGSGRKVRKQKGGGVARAGHSRPAHWRGGAKAHGPKGKIQDYSTKLNKKVRKLGIRHALSQKLKEGNLIVASDMAVPTHKTKELEMMLNRFGISGKKGVTALMVDDADEEDETVEENSVIGGLDVNLKVASGNLHKIQVLNQKGCHTYGCLKFKKLVLSLAAIRSLEERLERDL